MRKLNLPYLLVLLTAVAALGASGYFLNSWQVRRQVASLLDRARAAEAAGDLAKAAESLGQYLSFEREDAEGWKWYARILDASDRDGRGKERAFLAGERALQFDPNDAKLERRCADLALELGRHGDADRHAKRLLARLDTDAAAGPAAAELEEMIGRCAAATSRPDEAEQALRAAVGHDPARISAYARLASLQAGERRRPEEGAATIDEMLAKNPTSARALIARWRFRAEFQPPADSADVERALALAPDDPDVLLPAAVDSERKGDMATARVRWAKGLEVAPRNEAFAVGLARMESRERRPERAEAILRRAFDATPTATLAFLLADSLIERGKIEGPGGAAESMALLRSQGLGDTYVRYLESRVLMQSRRWDKAAVEIRRARVLLKDEPVLTSQLDLMLAECQRRLGRDEELIQTLQQASQGEGAASDASRRELARLLALAGKVDQALSVLGTAAADQPEAQGELVRLLIQRALRQPRDRRDWTAAEQAVQRAAKARGESDGTVVLLRADLLAAQGRLDEATSTLASAAAGDPANRAYRLALASLEARRGRLDDAERRIDAAERDLGPSVDVQIARLELWGLRGGEEAGRAIAGIAEGREQVDPAVRPALLRGLAEAERRLGRPDLARGHLRELASLRADELIVRLDLFDLAQAAGDARESEALIEKLRKIEGDDGTYWRYGRASLLIADVRRGGGANAEIDRRKLEEAAALEAEISRRRPEWWGGPALAGQVAELSDRPDEAIARFTRALELGSNQPELARRLVGLLDRQHRLDELDRLAALFGDRSVVLEQATFIEALTALRAREFDRAATLARRVFPESSTNFADHLALGRILNTAGRGREAVQEFRRATELAAGSPEAWLTLVASLVGEGRLDEAKAAMEAARKALPPGRTALMTLAQCHAALGEVDQARKLFDQGLADAKNPPDRGELRAATLFFARHGRSAQATGLIDRLEALPAASAQDRAWNRRARGLVLSTTGRPEDLDAALRLVDQNLAAAPDGIEDLRLKAAILSQRPAGRAEAVAILERLRGDQRFGAEDHFLLARTYLALKDWSKAKPEFQAALEGRPADPESLTAYAEASIQNGEAEAAGESIARLESVAPEALETAQLKARRLAALGRAEEAVPLLKQHAQAHADRRERVALTLEAIGRPEAAEELFRALAAEAPGAGGRLALASFLVRGKRTAEALDALEEAWKVPPEPIEPLAAASVEAVVRSQADQAQRGRVEGWLRGALRRQPDSLPLQFHLATLHLFQERYDEAEAIYRRLEAQDPSNAAVLDNHAWLLAVQGVRLDEALALSERCLALAGPAPEALNTRALVAIGLKRPSEAIADLDRAVAAGSPTPEMYLHLARAQMLTSNRQAAARALEDAGRVGLSAESLHPREQAELRRLTEELKGTPDPR
ncbi:tetratricopeptide repeat protein [Paludisphaera soli]|uniref:tetratricopeptide repeat protein n=1 Tax=Paludisphaera soli TaxID=2712865 RepID=UPI0013EDA9DC|nr:tetratricopeptide repeat protein [Paludisphaera soli]